MKNTTMRWLCLDCRAKFEGSTHHSEECRACGSGRCIDINVEPLSAADLEMVDKLGLSPRPPERASFPRLQRFVRRRWTQGEEAGLRRQMAATIAPVPQVIIVVRPLPASGTAFVPALPVPRSEGQTLPAEEWGYELTGAADTLNVLATLMVHADMPGARPRMARGRFGWPQLAAIECTMSGLREFWRRIMAERTRLLAAVTTPGAPDGLCGEFIRMTRAQWLVEAALGASVPHEGRVL